VENQDACPLKCDQTSHIIDYQAAAVKLRGRPVYMTPGRHQPTSCLATAATHIVVSYGKSTNQTTWAASDATVVTDTELKLVFQCYVDGAAASCRRQAVSDRRPPCSCLFTAFQVASKHRTWEVLHCFERKACWPTCVNGASQQPTVAKTNVQKLPMTLELRENGEWRHSRHSQQHNMSALALPGSCRRDVR